MNGNELDQETEISLLDFWQKLQTGWRYIVGGIIIGLLGAILGIVLIPQKYEAIAVVQVGQVANQPVEPATQVVERMKTPAFQLRIAEGLGFQKWIEVLKASANGTTDFLSLQVLKSTASQGALSLLEMKAKGDSPENAKKILDATVLELTQKQAEIAKPMLDKIRIDLAIAKEKQARTEKELQEINKIMANAGVKDDRFVQLLLTTSLRIQKDAELFGQRQLIMSIETSLMAPATQPAKTIEAAYVSEKPVSPKKSLLLILGLICGLLAGVLALFIRDRWRNANKIQATGSQ